MARPPSRLRRLGALLVKSRQEPGRLAMRSPGEHNRPMYASLPLRLALVLLLLARRCPQEKCSFFAPTCSSEEGHARPWMADQALLERTRPVLPFTREATGPIPLFFIALFLSEKLFRKFFGMTHVKLKRLFRHCRSEQLDLVFIYIHRTHKFHQCATHAVFQSKLHVLYVFCKRWRCST